jgi:hypothetical protein
MPNAIGDAAITITYDKATGFRINSGQQRNFAHSGF